jgi:hypothetical protein
MCRLGRLRRIWRLWFPHYGPEMNRKSAAAQGIVDRLGAKRKYMPISASEGHANAA